MMPAQAGIKKGKDSQESPIQEKLSIDQLKQGSTADGSVIIDVVGRLQAGDLVTFVLPNLKRVLGKVTKTTIIEDRRIHIVGLFLGEEGAGFGFVFDRSGQVGGTLLFKNTKEIYRLRYNEEKRTFFLMKDIYREDDSL